jgi:hypothetical protein
MKAIRGIVALALVTIIVAGVMLRRHSPGPPSNSEPKAVAEQPAAPVESASISDTAPADPPPPAEHVLSTSQFKTVYAAIDKLDRLHQIQERFRALAANDPTMALRAAKQLTNEVERESALLTLVTEWTHGELSSPRDRASRIGAYGLEAGLGFELTNQPELALAWVNELTDGQGRTDLLQAVARGMINSDPTAAFALTEQVSGADRRRFFDLLLSDWTSHDTAAALQWAEQITNPTDRDAAMRTIRAVAPTGIGAAMTVLDGHPVFNEVLPGTPAAVSGQIAPGDRLLAVAQGNNVFVDVQNLPLEQVVQMIRGSPGTPVQLAVLSPNAPPNTVPRTVYLYRDQIKFKK